MAMGRAAPGAIGTPAVSRVKALAPLFELRVATGGDNYTVNVARYHLKGDEPYLNEHAASLRAIYDLGDPAQLGCDAFQRPVGLVLAPDYRNFVASPGRPCRTAPVAQGERKLVLQGQVLRQNESTCRRTQGEIP
jgi:hypothetical protein